MDWKQKKVFKSHSDPFRKEAITTGVLSKRWQHLWTYVPALVFREYECWLFSFFPFVNTNLSQCHQTKLNKFKLIQHSIFPFESDVKSWIHYAIRCNVEEFDLNLKNWDLKGDSVLDELFFIASCFTHLKLNCCIFIPSIAITWETLKLNSYYALRWLDITSKSVKKLVLSDFYGEYKYECDESKDIIVINAPNVLSITIEGELWLSKLLLLNVSSLVKAELDYKKYGHTAEEAIEAKEEMLKELLLSLRHVKEVYIGISCLKTLSRLKAKGFIPPSYLKFPMNEAVSFENDLVSNSD